MVLKAKPQGETMTQIQILSGVSSRRPVGPVLRELIKEGYVVECQVHKLGGGQDGFAGYRLVYDPYDAHNPINFQPHPPSASAEPAT